MNKTPPNNTSDQWDRDFIKQYEVLEATFEAHGLEVPSIRISHPAETILRMQKILHDFNRRRAFVG